MMASLVATCGTVAILAGAIVALGAVARRSRSLPDRRPTAQILPFARTPVPRPQPPPRRPPLVAAWRRRQDHDGRWVLHLRWSSPPHPVDHDTADVRTATLVYPGEEDSRRGRLANVTPIGSALPGPRAGATMGWWRARDGRVERLSVLEVRYQPEAPGFDGASVSERPAGAIARPESRRAATST